MHESDLHVNKTPDSATQGIRRKLLKSIFASGGMVATGEMLPDTWRKPVIHSLLLPAHAQTTVGAGPTATTFSQTITSGELCPVLGTSAPVPDPAPFLFDWDSGGFTPTGDGTLTVTANGDITGNEGPNLEAWQISFNGGPFLLPLLGNTGTPLPQMQDTATEIYVISQADLLAAGSGLNVPVTATNQGRVDCDPGITNNLTFTLTFPAVV